MYRGDMSYRRLWALLDRLPQESWTQTELRDRPRKRLPAREGEQKFGPWALDNYQIAALTDAVNAVGVVIARVNGDKDYKVEPTARPGLKAVSAKAPQASSEASSEMAPEMAEATVLYLNRIRAKGTSPWQQQA